MWNIGLLGMLVTPLFAIFYILKKNQLRKVRKNIIKDKDSLLSEEDSQPVTSEAQASCTKNDNNLFSQTSVINPTSTSFRVVNALTSIFFYLFWVVVSLIYLPLVLHVQLLRTGQPRGHPVGTGDDGCGGTACPSLEELHKGGQAQLGEGGDGGDGGFCCSCG